MNGRIYDPLIGRFMSADSHVTFPLNLQSFNRYAYVLNNPLGYTDPTGNDPSGDEGEVSARDESSVAGLRSFELDPVTVTAEREKIETGRQGDNQSPDRTDLVLAQAGVLGPIGGAPRWGPLPPAIGGAPPSNYNAKTDTYSTPPSTPAQRLDNFFGTGSGFRGFVSNVVESLLGLLTVSEEAKPAKPGPEEPAKPYSNEEARARGYIPADELAYGDLWSAPRDPRAPEGWVGVPPGSGYRTSGGPRDPD